MCSCGKTEPHIIARRTTADAVLVYFWSDGSVTGCLGVNHIARPGRGKRKTYLALEANRLAMEEVGLHDWRRMPELIAHARAAVAQTFTRPRTYLVNRMAGLKPVRVDRRGAVHEWKGEPT